MVVITCSSDCVCVSVYTLRQTVCGGGGVHPTALVSYPEADSLCGGALVSYPEADSLCGGALVSYPEADSLWGGASPDCVSLRAPGVPSVDSSNHISVEVRLSPVRNEWHFIPM